MFHRPRGTRRLGGLGGSQPSLCLTVSQVQSDMSLCELLKGEGQRQSWCRSRADGNDFYQKVLSS